MLAKRSSHFDVTCDVCGTSARIEASDWTEAWEKLKRGAWAVRKRAFPIIHICPECPVEVSSEAA